ncbi:hypothetical protein INT76_03665 [Streptococcus oriscaviae]|uniref:Phage protein n=1 Tax=Streptococcus oriscaviae TaxID=2781599 RepID=A0ABX7YNE0_9STRE|nr:hypothetical protein INT76_03665 [Streptococcus oriscaviae]
MKKAHKGGKEKKKVNEILNAEKYTSLVVETEEGKKIAEITLTEVIPAEGYVVRLTPKYD